MVSLVSNRGENWDDFRNDAFNSVPISGDSGHRSSRNLLEDDNGGGISRPTSPSAKSSPQGRRRMMKRQASCSAITGRRGVLATNRQSSCANLQTTRSKRNEDSKQDRRAAMRKQLSLSAGLGSISDHNSSTTTTTSNNNKSSSLKSSSSHGTVSRQGMRHYLHKQRSFSGSTMGKIDKSGRFVPSRTKP